jgi:hypothetical protein
MSSYSRYARRASSSVAIGIGTIEETRGSPLAIKVRSNMSTSMMSVFVRRARRSTGVGAGDADPQIAGDQHKQDDGQIEKRA